MGLSGGWPRGCEACQGGEMDILLMVAGAVVWYLGKKGESTALRVLGGLIIAAGGVWAVCGLIVGCSIMATL